MPLDVVYYGHPALRSKGKKIEKIDASIHEFADQMIQAMYHYEGCGLAAQQVGRSLQLAVIDVVEGMKSRPSKAWQHGKPLDIESIMPLVIINPEIIPVTQKTSYEIEGCISIPEVYAKVKRPARVKIRYQSLEGNLLEIEAEGLLARAAMHEVDHLHGILFTDYLSPKELQEHQAILKRLAQRNSVF
ncbi:MAG: peptide deformylase [Chthoniobacterales bacterium]|nr:peptide deformylase [Chthoniobacterales bacterium]